MTKGEKVLSTTVGVMLVVVCAMSVWLAFADMATADAKARAEEVEELNRKLRTDYAEVREDLARCRASVKVVERIKIITKTYPGSWWTSPQDTVRDTIYSVPDSVSTWLWGK